LAPGLLFLYCRNTLDTVAWYLAALESSAAVALLDADLPQEFRDALAHAYRPDFIVDTANSGTLWRRGESGSDLHPDLKQMLSTSGTTGSPQFVRLTLRNVISNAASIAQALAIQERNRAITSLPIYYSYGLSVLNSHLFTGASVVLTGEPLMRPAFWKLVREQACTSLAGVPFSYKVLHRLDLDDLNAPSIEVMTQAGGRLADSLVTAFSERMQARGGQFYVMYGQTEGTARIAILPAARLPEKLGSVGQVIPGGTIRIVDDEIIYNGPNVMMGYAGDRDDLRKGDERHGHLATEDLGYLDNEGFLFITGRRKRDFKLCGRRVNLDEIEHMLLVHGPTAIVGHNDRLIAFCEYGDRDFLRGLRNQLAWKLNVAAVAFDFRRVDRLPTTTSGKVDYKQLSASL